MTLSATGAFILSSKTNHDNSEAYLISKEAVSKLSLIVILSWASLRQAQADNWQSFKLSTFARIVCRQAGSGWL